MKDETQAHPQNYDNEASFRAALNLEPVENIPAKKQPERNNPFDKPTIFGREPSMQDMEWKKLGHLAEMFQISKVNHIAQELEAFVMETGASTKIGDNDHLYVEAWQFVMMHFGCIYRTISCVETTPSGTNDWSFMAEGEVVHLLSGTRVAYANAECSVKEKKRKEWERPALRSMAQTRAQGKAGRMLFAFLANLAGFEATPAEEMEDIGGGATKERVIRVKTPATEDQLYELEPLMQNALIPRTDADLKKAQGLIADGKLSESQAAFYLKKFAEKIESESKKADNY